jgi:hypothetical protein
VGSLVPIPYTIKMNQIYKMIFYKGNVLALDAGDSALYQLPPGATVWNNISGGILQSCGLGGAFDPSGMTIDALGTIYISDNIPPSCASNALFWRIPYDPVANTWHYSTANAWGSNIIDPYNKPNAIVSESGQGSSDVVFENSPAMDGSGTLYFVSYQNQIYSIPVTDEAGDLGNGGVATGIINALNGGGAHLAIDPVGNIYFVEGHAITVTSPGVRPPGTTGIWFIPANTTVPGVLAGGAAEAYLLAQNWRIDYEQIQDTNAGAVIYAGVTLDSAGNLYMSSETNVNYAETFSGLWEIPNVCGPSAVTGANLNQCLDDSHIVLLAGIPGNQPVAIDPRGYFWMTPYQTYAPGGENTQTNVYAIGVFEPGVMNLNNGTPGQLAGPTPTGTTGGGLPGNLYVAFNGTFTPTAFQFSNATGTASQFATTQVNPIPVPNAANPTVPCDGQSGTPLAYQTFKLTNSCLLWVTEDPTVPGGASADLTIYGTTPNSAGTGTNSVSTNVYVYGTGTGGAVAMLNSPQLNTLAASNALNAPGQVATDVLGDTWVADSGEKQVLYFPAGSSSAAAKSVGTGLSDPTGVAVDGAGDIYIADWNSSKKLGSVYEIPWVPNTTSKAGGAYGAQITLSTKTMGLGNNLNLAVDGTGDVFIADPNNARVVEILTPARTFLIPDQQINNDSTTTVTVTIGSGFNAPSAVAVDSSGNLFVADGTSLYEIAAYPSYLQTTITASLPGTVTGLTVDASGSVIAAISGQGLYRIPNIITAGVAALSVNSASLIDTSFTLPGTSNTSSPLYCGGPGACTTTINVTSPGGVALDREGNIYVTDTTNGPNLYQMNVVSGVVNYGVGLTPLIADEQDLDLFNIGNEPLNLTPNPPSFSGPDLLNYSLTAPGAGTKCDTSGATAVAPGAACTLGPTFTPPGLTDLVPHIYSDTLSIPTNASNINGGGTATATLQAASINNLETTTTLVVPNLTSKTYPGAATVTVNISLATGSAYQYPPPAVGTKIGTVELTLSCSSVGCTQAPIVETGTVQIGTSGPGDAFSASTTFNNLPPLDGGSYTVTANYQGSVLNLMAKSSNTQSFTINKATPVITLSEPVGVTPNATNGVYYLLQGVGNTLVTNVSSKVGSPTGIVALWNNPVITNGVCSAGTTGTEEGTATYTSNQNWDFSTGSLAGGLTAPAYNIIACYQGDENYSALATTVPVTFQVITLGVLLTANPASLTTTAGIPVATTITIQSLVGFSAPSGANISCEVSPTDTVPYYSECTFNNPQPQICAPTATNNTCTPSTTVLTLTTNIPVNYPPTASNTHRPQPFSRSPFALAGIFGLGLLGLALRRRAIFNRYLLNLVCLGLFFAGTVMGITSCTNDGYTHTPPIPVVTTPASSATNVYKISVQVTNSTTGVVESLPFTLPVTINAQ